VAFAAPPDPLAAVAPGPRQVWRAHRRRRSPALAWAGAACRRPGRRALATAPAESLARSGALSGLWVEAEALSVAGQISAAGGDSLIGHGGSGGNLGGEFASGASVTGSILLTGGRGTFGGDGGTLEIRVTGRGVTAGGARGLIALTGMVDASGGDGLKGAGGSAGRVVVSGREGAVGACDAHGAGVIRAGLASVAVRGDRRVGRGRCDGRGRGCGMGGGATTVEVTGGVAASGGASATADGGAAGLLRLSGAETRLGPAVADGGAAPAGKGGLGGAIEVVSKTATAKLTGRLSVRGGAGPSSFGPGTLKVNDVVVPLTGGVYEP
jgi:hypothetical protein